MEIVRQSKMGIRSLVILACLVSWSARADEVSPLTIHGFGTLAATRTTSDDVNYVRDLSQSDGARRNWTGKTDSLLGIQFSAHLATGWEAVLQTVTRYRPDRSFQPEITWAYLKHDPSPHLSLRLGRVETEFLMLADSRDVAYSYLTVRPPSDYFVGLPFRHVDGLDVAATLPVAGGIVRGKTYVGLEHENIPLDGPTWRLNDSLHWGAYLEYLSGPWQARASLARIHFRGELPLDLIEALKATGLPSAQQAASRLSVDGTTSQFIGYALMFDQGPWQALALYNHIQHQSHAFENSNAAYFQAGYRFGTTTPFLGASWVRSHARPPLASGLPLPNPLDTAISQGASRNHADQHTLVAGLRWDVTEHVACKFQWDGVRGKPTSTLPYRMIRPSWQGRMDVYSVSLDFVF